MIRRAILLSCIVVSACARQPSTGVPRPQTSFDVVLENGRVIDGTGAGWFLGDVGITGDRIARIGAAGSLRRFPAKQRLDVRGLVVSPGFIDIQSGTNFLGDGRSVSKVTQGDHHRDPRRRKHAGADQREDRRGWSVRDRWPAGDRRVFRPARVPGMARCHAGARHVA